MHNDALDAQEHAGDDRLQYETPELTVYGTVADLTRQQVEPTGLTGLTETVITFPGDNV